MKREKTGIWVLTTVCFLLLGAQTSGQANHAELDKIIQYFNEKIQISNLNYTLIDHVPSMVFKNKDAYESFKANFKLEDYMKPQQKICCLNYDSEHGDYCYKELAKEDFDNNQLHARSGLFLGKSGTTWWNGQPKGFTVLVDSPSGNTVENGRTNTFFSGVTLDATLFVHLGLGHFQRGTLKAEPLNESRSKWSALTEQGPIHGMLESRGDAWSLITTNQHQQSVKKIMFEWDHKKSLPESVTVLDPVTDKIFQHYVTFEGKEWWTDTKASFSYGHHTNTTDAILFIHPDGQSEIKHGGKLIDESPGKGSIRPMLIMAFIAVAFVVLLNITKQRKE